MGWLRNLIFGPPPEDPRARLLREQPDARDSDWKAGDLGKCIIPGDGGWSDASTLGAVAGPRRGDIVRVVDAYLSHEKLWLVLRGFGSASFPAGHFRKLRPCSTEFEEEVYRPVKAPARRRVDA